MSEVNTNQKWEDVFIQESVELEERMSTFDIDSLNKSKLRLSIENSILNWEKYETWVIENLQCSSLKNNIPESILKNFSSNAKQAHEIYSNYDFWNEDLIPVCIWDSSLIVFGLQYNENLVNIKNHIFILAKPEILDYFAKLIFNKEEVLDAEIEELEKSSHQTISRIEGLELNAAPPVNLDFKDLSFDTAPDFAENKNEPLAEVIPLAVSEEQKEIDENTIWDFINERHDEYSFEARKNFSAYIVLKIDHDQKTHVFKMDQDLESHQINEKLFEYSLREDNPFSKVYDSGVSASFNISQLGLNLLNFKYACITALKRADKTMGFLIGFKEGSLSETDQQLLEELAKESA
ncbi:hypothetical protein [Pseudobdellovibrio exovorus]|uniref:Uncharacterized protein n=1 Tax=Pseudobdellovibrio exovorus JSS TaxID=1184267 RepID=M4V8P9_9BACT|nr:hypothetical protein [Pseudobdellovibrio exovorus]AGH95583.1 hypothetical protein A11Q_1367 [Pseudobdellovibrio exovorus JSS]